MHSESPADPGVYKVMPSRGILENIPYYKFALVHCARRVHTPEMEERARFIKREAIYKYDKIWGFRDFIRDFFVLANKHKGLSRDVDVDEILKKAIEKEETSLIFIA